MKLLRGSWALPLAASMAPLVIAARADNVRIVHLSAPSADQFIYSTQEK
jgi:hypothetical protein